MARFLLILSYDTKDQDQVLRTAERLANWNSQLRLEGVYQEQPIGDQR